MKLVTYQYIQDHKSEKGGWTKKQLSALGVDWPPQKGWIHTVEGKLLTEEQVNTFELQKSVTLLQK
jgi:hypothetical protein